MYTVELKDIQCRFRLFSRIYLWCSMKEKWTGGPSC